MMDVLNNPNPMKTIIVQIPMDRTAAVNQALMRLLQTKGYQGVYVTFEKNYDDVVKEFSSNGVDLNALYFIDGISNLYGMGQAKNDHVDYVKGPLALSDLSDKIKNSLASLKSEKTFIYLDSLTSLMLYNPVVRLIEFLHSINAMTAPKQTLIFASQLCDQNLKRTLEASLEKETIGIDLRDFS